MIGRIVITSVPQGLDGGTGFQPVLRTQALQGSIAARLAMRASYPHPFPFGDRRNPHVLFHRIEMVGDRTIHVLGSIRDAGASYTRRSNYLAELIAIDPAETRGLPGGPAFAAKSFHWLSQWTGSPREVPLDAEPVIPGHDPIDPEATGRPGRCVAWEKATGDAGWAGELAQSFLDGRRALIWAGENIDILELFVEAARLLPASVRWQLTFNTCEIEPFPAHWRAVRPELGLVGNYEPKNELRIVPGKLLESRSRAPDHNLARLARGETPGPSFHQPPEPGPVYGGAATSNPTSPNSDDTALRARLKEISEERRRRSGAGRAALGESDGRGHRPLLATALLLGGLAVLGVGMAAVVWMAIMTIRYPDVMNRWLAPRETQVAITSPDVDLRTSQQQQEQETAKEADQNKATDEANRQKAEQDRIERKKKAQQNEEAAQNKNEKLATEKEQAEKDDREARAQQEKLAAQRKAVEDLMAKPELTVQLRDPDSSPSEDGLNPVNEPKEPKEVLLCNDFDVENLIDVTFDLACPCDDEARMGVDREQASLGDTRIWTVTGKVYDGNAGWQPPAPACQIVARDGKKLFLIPKPGEDLFCRLENSLLLIYTRDPGSQDGPLVQRRRIFLSKPIAIKEPYRLDPLAEDDKFTVDIDQAVKDRLLGIDPKRLDWSTELIHPTLDEPVLLSSSHTHATLPLAKPPHSGIEVKYHRLESADGFCERVVHLRIDATITCTGTSFVFSRTLAETEDDSAFLSPAFAFDALRAGRDKKQWDRVTKQFVKQLQTQSDPLLEELTQQLANLQRPIPYDPRTEQSRTASIDAEQKRKQKYDDTHKRLADRRAETTKRFASDGKSVGTTLQDHIDWLKPIVARITKLEAIACDRNGTEYRISIVKPADD